MREPSESKAALLRDIGIADEAAGEDFLPVNDIGRSFQNHLYFSSTCHFHDPETYAFVRSHFDETTKLDEWTEESLNVTRIFLKNTHMENPTAAKSSLAQLLIRCLKGSDSYQSFACLTASAIGLHGKASNFQWNNPAWKCNCPTSHRLQYTFLMDILFRTKHTAKVLDEGCNIYRITHCISKHSTRRDAVTAPLFYSFFTFIFQLLLTLYVLVHCFQFFFYPEDEENVIPPFTLPVAIMTTIIAFLILRNQIDVYWKVRNCGFWSDWTLLSFCDFFSNVVIPMILVPAGFILILISQNYVECVLNGMSLFFITEIDEILPRILGLPLENIVRKFLIDDSIAEFDRFCAKKLRIEKEPFIPLFRDYFLTSRGTTEICEPYEIVFERSKGTGHCILPNTFITPGCIFRKIEFKLASYKETNNIQDNINWLKLYPLDRTASVVEFKLQEPETESKVFSLKGFLLITTFEVSRRIAKLRVCGSPDPKSFLEALEYFQLWDVAPEVEDLLKHSDAQRKIEDCELFLH